MPRLLAGAALLAVVLSAAASALAATPATTIVHWQPFDLSGRTSGIHIDRTTSGSCFAGSIALPRRDAWRCRSGHQILDPCVQAPEGAAPLVCSAGSQIIRLRLLHGLPLARRNTGTRFVAWRFVLRNGDSCERLTGTSAGSVRGRALSYGCHSGAVATAPARGQAVWIVSYVRKRAPQSAAAEVQVKSALG